MRFILLSSLLFLSILSANCESKYYPTVDMPFCVSNTPWKESAPEKEYVVLRKHSRGYTFEPILQSFGGSYRSDPIGSRKTLFAVISCSALDAQYYNADEIMKEFTQDSIPSICADQKTIIFTTLEAEKDPRAAALGYGGFYHFPKIDLGCQNGKTVQDNLYTFGQIMGDFAWSVDSYIEKYKKLPATFEELQEATLAATLPKDPWGNSFQYQIDGQTVRLISPGPDNKPGTGDDLNVCSVREGSSNHSLSFEGVDIPTDVDYKTFLKNKGIN